VNIIQKKKGGSAQTPLSRNLKKKFFVLPPEQACAERTQPEKKEEGPDTQTGALVQTGGNPLQVRRIGKSSDLLGDCELQTEAALFDDRSKLGEKR